MGVYPSLVLIQISLFCLAILPFVQLLRIKNNKIILSSSQSYKNCIVLLCYIFCIIASYDGDWYHYKEVVYENYYLTNPFTHIEPIHLWIIKHLSFGNYIIWRMVIWGYTILLIKLSFKRIGCDDVITWTSFILVYLLTISTGRVYLGIALLFYGFCCLIRPKRKYLSSIKGLFLMSFSLVFHKSIFIYLIAALIALIYYRKWMIITAITALPIIIKIFTSVLIMIVIADNLDKNAMGYLSTDQESKGIGISLYNNTIKLIQIIIFVIGSYVAINNKHLNNKIINSMLKNVFNLWYIYIVVFIALTLNDIGSLAISGRILGALGLPLSIILSFLLKSKTFTKSGLIICSVLAFANLYRLLYAYYLQRMGLGI